MLRRWFDLDEPAGEPPDYRFSLANERTFLAWIRTALALIGGGVAVAAFVPALRWAHVWEVITIALLLLGSVVAIRAVDHWSRSERAMRLGQALPRSRFPAVLALAIGLGALTLIVMVILGGRP